MSDNICTRCGQTGHRASHCHWPVMRITGLVGGPSAARSRTAGMLAPALTARARATRLSRATRGPVGSAPGPRVVSGDWRGHAP